MEADLNENQIQDIRARERTLDGAYMRTCLGLLGASLLAIRLFDRELRYIGVVLVLFGVSMFTIDRLRRKSLDDFKYDSKVITTDLNVGEDPFLKRFLTSGKFVAMAGTSALVAYSLVIGIIWFRP